jgi:hypothetical protein
MQIGFHVEVKERPPGIESVCHRSGGRLFQREDDLPGAMAVRLAAYGRQAPLQSSKCYKNLGLLIPILAHPILAHGFPDEIRARTMTCFEDGSFQESIG